MSICHVFLGSHFAPEISRREIKTVKDIPNFEREDIVYPCDMGPGTDVCLDPESAVIWFEDDDGNEIARFRLDPSLNNGIKYVDGGNVFDETDSSKSYFYFCLLWDKQVWADCDCEIEEGIQPAKISVKFQRYFDADGDAHVVLDSNSITYDGEELYFENRHGDGTDGEDYWVLMDGKRKAVLPPGKVDE